MPLLRPDGSDATLDALADHCLAARALIGEHGSPVMRRLVDLLLFEISVAMARRIAEEPDYAVERNDRA